mmetsp:Transcript_43059/g.69882  ORF Transcript_43059/g.69882 Transcript_43059/m.69882 type:complete len:376 (+) Transcript_43059:200-1327(+)
MNRHGAYAYFIVLVFLKHLASVEGAVAPVRAEACKKYSSCTSCTQDLNCHWETASLKCVSQDDQRLDSDPISPWQCPGVTCGDHLSCTLCMQSVISCTWLSSCNRCIHINGSVPQECANSLPLQGFNDCRSLCSLYSSDCNRCTSDQLCGYCTGPKSCSSDCLPVLNQTSSVTCPVASSGNSNLAIIIGCVVGGVVLLIVIAVLVWYFCFYRKRDDQDDRGKFDRNSEYYSTTAPKSRSGSTVGSSRPVTSPAKTIRMTESKRTSVVPSNSSIIGPIEPMRVNTAGSISKPSTAGTTSKPSTAGSASKPTSPASTTSSRSKSSRSISLVMQSSRPPSASESPAYDMDAFMFPRSAVISESASVAKPGRPVRTGRS